MYWEKNHSATESFLTLYHEWASDLGLLLFLYFSFIDYFYGPVSEYPESHFQADCVTFSVALSDQKIFVSSSEMFHD